MTLRIVIHNVGHGQSVHAFTPQGQVIVVDLGCSSDFSPLDWLGKSRSKIDMLVITHPHGDHIDEMPKLGQLEFEVSQFRRPTWLTSQEVYHQSRSLSGEPVG